MKQRLSRVLVALTATVTAVTGLASCSEKRETIALWEAGPPGFEARKNEPEVAKDWWVRNVHYPTLTAFFPAPSRRNGAAVIIAPGGGFERLVYAAEGVAAARYLNQLGVTAFVLKYRLPKDIGSPYTLGHVREDAYRAMRLVRSRANEWRLERNRIGMLGFSAGGGVVGLVAYGSGAGESTASDPIERHDGKPSFQILVYPDGELPKVVSPDAPPTFLVTAMDDEYGCQETTLSLFLRMKAARVPVEAHFLARGKHAFNLGQHSPFESVRGWPVLMGNWLKDSGFLRRSER